MNYKRGIRSRIFSEKYSEKLFILLFMFSFLFAYSNRAFGMEMPPNFDPKLAIALGLSSKNIFEDNSFRVCYKKCLGKASCEVIDKQKNVSHIVMIRNEELDYSRVFLNRFLCFFYKDRQVDLIDIIQKKKLNKEKIIDVSFGNDFLCIVYAECIDFFDEKGRATVQLSGCGRIISTGFLSKNIFYVVYEEGRISLFGKEAESYSNISSIDVRNTQIRKIDIMSDDSVVVLYEDGQIDFFDITSELGRKKEIIPIYQRDDFFYLICEGFIDLFDTKEGFKKTIQLRGYRDVRDVGLLEGNIFYVLYENQQIDLFGEEAKLSLNICPIDVKSLEIKAINIIRNDIVSILYKNEDSSIELFDINSGKRRMFQVYANTDENIMHVGGLDEDFFYVFYEGNKADVFYTAIGERWNENIIEFSQEKKVEGVYRVHNKKSHSDVWISVFYEGGYFDIFDVKSGQKISNFIIQVQGKSVNHIVSLSRDIICFFYQNGEVDIFNIKATTEAPLNKEIIMVRDQGIEVVDILNDKFFYIIYKNNEIHLFIINDENGARILNADQTKVINCIGPISKTVFAVEYNDSSIDYFSIFSGKKLPLDEVVKDRGIESLDAFDVNNSDGAYFSVTYLHNKLDVFSFITGQKLNVQNSIDLRDEDVVTRGVSGCTPASISLFYLVYASGMLEMFDIDTGIKEGQVQLANEECKEIATLTDKICCIEYVGGKVDLFDFVENRKLNNGVIEVQDRKIKGVGLLDDLIFYVYYEDDIADLFDVKTGWLRRSITLQRSPVREISFLEGKFLYILYKNYSIDFFDLAIEGDKKQIDLPSKSICYKEILRDRYLCVVYEDREVDIFDIDRGMKKRRLQAQRRNVEGIGILEGRLFFIAYEDTPFKDIYDVETGKIFGAPWGEKIASIKLSNQVLCELYINYWIKLKKIGTESQDNEINIKIRNQEVLDIRALNNNIFYIVYAENEVDMFDIQTGAQQYQMRDFSGEIKDIGLQDEASFFVAYKGTHLRDIFDIQTGEKINGPQGPKIRSQYFLEDEATGYTYNCHLFSDNWIILLRMFDQGQDSDTIRIKVQDQEIKKFAFLSRELFYILYEDHAIDIFDITKKIGIKKKQIQAQYRDIQKISLQEKTLLCITYEGKDSEDILNIEAEDSYKGLTVFSGIMDLWREGVRQELKKRPTGIVEEQDEERVISVFRQN